MLIAAFFFGIMSLFGDPSLAYVGQWYVDDFQPHVVDVIQAPDREKKAKKESKKIGKELKAYNKGLEKMHRQFLGLLRNYRSMPDEFDRLFDTFVEGNKQFSRLQLNNLDTMKSLVTPDEWQEASNKTTKGMVKE